MNRAMKVLLILSLVVFSASCKLAVIVVEGGEVQSTSSGVCIASAVCVVDVDDPNFSETFTAVPFAGWYFEKWISGDRFFCGGSPEPNCTLSFQGHEESESVEKMVASSEMFYLMPVFKEAQHVVEVDGREWLQPALFTEVSWDEIDAICPEGICAGELSDINLNGWKWASADDVNSLFNHYIGFDVLGPGPDSYLELHSEWAPAFFSDGWIPTSSPDQSLVMEVQGWLRDFKMDTGDGYFASINNIMYEVENDEVQDGAGTVGDNIPSEKRAGAWFYRSP